jgi:mono/diheme cytochrome c family protein
MSAPEPPESPDEKFRDPVPPEEIDLPRVHGSILREHREPAEGVGPVPVWFAMLMLALCLWGVLYLANRSGDFRADVFNPVAAPTPGPPEDPATLGQRVFMRNCMLCHQFDGRGVAGQYPPLAGSEWVLGTNGHQPQQIVAIVLHGAEGPLEVKGEVFYGSMAPWRLLRDDEIAAVLTYVRNSWGNSAPPITPEFVARVREATKDREKPWSQPELEELRQ